MTYQFYKDNIGKLTKEVRAKFKFLGMKLRYEEEQELLRKTGIHAWVKRAAILNDGDTIGLLYDKLQESKEENRKQGLIIMDLKKQLEDNEPWQVAGY